MGIISYIREEIQVIRERDPAIKSNMEVFLYPSFRVILRYRIAHKLYQKRILLKCAAIASDFISHRIFEPVCIAFDFLFFVT